MKNILRVLKLSKPLYGWMLLSGLLISLTSLFALAAPFFSKLAVDEIATQISTGNGDINRLLFFIVGGFAVAMLVSLFTALSNRIGDHLSGKFRKFMTETFYDKVLRLPQTYFNSQISGKIVNQLNRGITSLQEFINTSTNFILPSLLQVIMVVIVLAIYSPVLAVLIFLMFPLYIYISYYSTKVWGKREEAKYAIEDVTRGRFSEVVTNMQLVKSYTNEKREYGFISNNLQEINNIYAIQSRNYHIFDFIRSFALNVIISIMLFITFYNAFQGSISLGDLVLIVELINLARIPLWGMSFILTQLQQAESGSKEFFEVLNLESVEDYTVEEEVEKIKNPEIKFENVAFAYEENTNVIEDISFEIKQNEVVALVGPSGAGKSTLINLIMKFYEPKSGTITLNGEDYKNLTQKHIRQNISLVFQDNELFSSTIKENVCYGGEENEERVVDALKKANAWDFVSKMTDGINTNIGERGVKLSGGQKQRIQIARAIYKNAPILILDEATSNLDAKSEYEVQEALDLLMKDKLVIIIAHRFSTIQNATKVIVLDNHKIENIGTPQELAKRPGIYSELLKYQVEGNKKLLKKFEIY